MDKQVFDSIKKTQAVTLPKRAIALLYGSQARGDALRDSDCDIMIVLDKDKLLTDDYDTVTYPSRITPFYHNVIKDAIAL